MREPKELSNGGTAVRRGLKKTKQSLGYGLTQREGRGVHPDSRGNRLARTSTESTPGTGGKVNSPKWGNRVPDPER